LLFRISKISFSVMSIPMSYLRQLTNGS
jgi:hypothetical protein